MRVPPLSHAVLSVALLACAPATIAKGRGSHGSYSPHTHWHRATCGVSNDSRGHIARSAHAKEEFRRSHPCPATGRSTAPILAGWSITSKR